MKKGEKKSIDRIETIGGDGNLNTFGVESEDKTSHTYQSILDLGVDQRNDFGNDNNIDF